MSSNKINILENPLGLFQEAKVLNRAQFGIQFSHRVATHLPKSKVDKGLAELSYQLVINNGNALELLKSLYKLRKVSGHKQKIEEFQKSGLYFAFFKKEKKWYFLLEVNKKPQLYMVEKRVKPTWELFLLLNNYYHLVSASGTSQQHRALADKDELTGLYNQRRLKEDLKQIINDHKQEKETFGVLFVDCDEFKKVNDQYGHIVGSKLLTMVGKTIKKDVRETDYLYRYGGDEFVIILPKIDQENLYMVAQRFSKSLQAGKYEIDKVKFEKLTVSIGIAIYPNDAKGAESILRFADSMMYQSKKDGKGKIFHVKRV